MMVHCGGYSARGGAEKCSVCLQLKAIFSVRCSAGSFITETQIEESEAYSVSVLACYFDLSSVRSKWATMPAPVPDDKGSESKQRWWSSECQAWPICCLHLGAHNTEVKPTCPCHRGFLHRRFLAIVQFPRRLRYQPAFWPRSPHL